ncbi:MAG: UbiD family decarboxylase [Desulfurococcales archaeon]|nr:UbiD family decarboxylase [Desulfurococcales archaeon]
METGSLARFLEGVEVERVPGVLSREYEPARLIYRGQGRGPALLFRVEGVPQDSASNIIDTRDKLYRALRVSGDEEAYRRLLGSLSSPSRLHISGAPRLRVAERGLMSLPAIRFYEGEGGLYISSSIFIACSGEVCNASIHRIMVTGEREARVRLVPRHLYRMWREAAGKGKDLPVTVVIGVNPLVTLSAALTPPYGVFELEIASSLLGGLEAFESPVHGNPVPAGAAAIVEARLTPKLEDEGPYVDALGTYDRVRKQPVLAVDRVYLNMDEPTHVIMQGGLEHVMLMGFPREAQIWRSVSGVVPRVHKVRLTPASGGWLHAVISIDKNHDGDGKNAIMAAFAGHPSLKHVVVVDSDVDPEDPGQVEWAIATRFQADRDLVVVREARGSTLDPSSRDGMTSKVGVDATMPLGGGLVFRRGRIPGV